MIVLGGWMRWPVRPPSQLPKLWFYDEYEFSKDKSTLHFGDKGLLLDNKELNYYLEVLCGFSELNSADFYTPVFSLLNL